MSDLEFDPNGRDDEAFILWYEDTDMPMELFSGNGARACAEGKYRRQLSHWSCHLFERVSPDSATELAALRERVARADEALKWYAEKVADCRKITPDGDNARNSLDNDGGKRAKAALEGAQEGQR